MSLALFAHSPDLRRLRDEGYEIAVVNGLLIMSHVPYVTANRGVKFGTLVSELTLAGDVTTMPETHTVRFAGQQPCDEHGAPLTKVINSAINEQIAPDLTVTYLFSSKPDTGYTDYFHKLTTYAAMLGAHAAAVDPEATACTFRVLDPDDPGSVFNYLDTASSRAGIVPINAKLAVPRVAIIGLGGSGSYVLDLLVKAPIEEIHLFDGDDLLQHNAFRAPGAISREQLQQRPKKVDHYAQTYAVFRRGIIAHPYFIDESNVDELRTMSFVFICMDQGRTKRHLVKALEQFNIGFVDVGMGLYTADDAIAGHVRVTTSTPNHRAHVWEQRLIPFEDNHADDYGTNIQVAELNALTATHAVIAWKKQLGFYANLEPQHHSVYTISTGSLLGEPRS